jgi:hypothetical protein
MLGRPKRPLRFKGDKGYNSEKLIKKLKRFGPSLLLNQTLLHLKSLLEP